MSISISVSHPSHAATPVSHSKSHILHQLEQTRAAYMMLLSALDAASSKRKSLSSKRTLLAVAAHIVMSMEMTYPMFISRAQAGEKLSMPAYFASPFGHWLSYVLSERRANKESLATLDRAYETAHDNLLIQVNKLSDMDFALTCMLPKPRNEVVSIETFLLVEIPRHFEIHEQEIRQSLRAFTAQNRR